MNKVKIRLLKLGYVPELDLYKLKSLINRSEIISVTEFDTIDIVNFRGICVDINDLKSIYTESKKVDFTIGVVSKELEGNYFSKPYLDEKLILLSIKDFKYFTQVNKITPEIFAIRFIYGFVSMFKAYRERLPTEIEVIKDNLFQTNFQGCLFDLCMDKQDSLAFFNNPKISTSALAVLKSKSLPEGFLKQLQTEIKWLRISWLDRMSKWINKRPILSMIIVFTVGLVSNVLASLIIKLFKI